VELQNVVTTIETFLAERHFAAPTGLVSRIVGGWLVGDIVVLAGAPGTGKTSLARSLGKALEQIFAGRFSQAFLEVGPDYDVAQFLGYENLAGEFSAGRFAKEVLFVGEPSDPRLVVLDEWNLSQIDTYFAPILSVIETGVASRLPGRIDLGRLPEEAAKAITRAQPGIDEGEWSLPTDTFFLATCNSWVDEPETRLPISGPVKRRCRVISVPNALALRFEEKGQAAIIEISDMLLAQEMETLETRVQTGTPSVWDEHRRGALTRFSSFSALEGNVKETLMRVTRALLENPATSATFTVGLLRDVLLSTVYAGANAFAALGEQITDKVLHQVQGDTRVLESIVQITKALPNAAEIEVLARRMGAFSGGGRIRPLV
jgi:hypothetical protein